MTEKYTPAPGDSVWVKLKGYRFCPWWPGKVIDPEISLTKYRGKKKLVAAVTFPSDDTITFVNDENCILPFDCTEKEAFIECGRELQCRSQPLRLAFDCDVGRCQRYEKDTSPPSPTDMSTNSTPAPPTLQLQRTRCRTEPSLRTVSSPFCMSSPATNERWKTTEACLTADDVSSQMSINSESIFTDESTQKRCAIPPLDSSEIPLTNTTDDVSLEFVHTSPSAFPGETKSGDPVSVEMSDAHPRISLPKSPPVCILYSQEGGGENAGSPWSSTPPVLFSQWPGGQKTSEIDPSMKMSPAVSQFHRHSWTGPVFGVLPQTVSSLPSRVRSTSPTVDELCRPQAKPPPDLCSEWMPMISDNSYTVERSTDYKEQPNTSRVRYTCSSSQQTHPAGKCSFIQKRKTCAKKWSPVRRRWSHHSPKRRACESQKRRITAKEAVSANRHVPNRASKLVSIPVRLSRVTSNRPTSKHTAALARRKTSSEITDVPNRTPPFSWDICVNTRLSSSRKATKTDQLSDVANRPLDLLPDMEPAPLRQCCAIVNTKYSAASEERSTPDQSDIFASRRSSDVPAAAAAAATADQSLDVPTVATKARSSLDQSNGIANGLSAGLLDHDTSEASQSLTPAAKTKSLPHRSTIMTRRQSSLARPSRMSSDELVPSTTSPCPPPNLPATNGLQSSNPLTVPTDRKPCMGWLATVANEPVPSVTSPGPAAAVTNRWSSAEQPPEADRPVTNDLDDDDDDLPQMMLDSGITGPIGKGDLVWLKSRQFPFWPAIVKNVYKQKSRVRKITCCFIGKSSDSEHREKPYTAMFHKKKVVPFSIDPLQHSRLKALGMQSAYASEFEEAVKKAEDFICQRAVEKTVTSLEFFADEIGSTSTCLNGDSASPEEDTSVEDHGPHSITEDHMSDGSVSGDEVSEELSMSAAQRRRIERRREYGQTLIEVIKCDHTKQHLEMIWTGQLKSPRHDQFRQKAMLSREQKWAIKMHGHGPIDDDNQIDELVSTVANFYKSWDSEINMTYVIDVLVPEAIVYALQKVLRVNKQKAEKIFQKGIQWTKEEIAAFGQDLIRNADNIDPEDRMIYRENANRLARRLSFAV